MKKLLNLYIFFVVLLFIFPLFNQSLASHKVFQDNFDDGNADGWIVTRNPCLYNGLPAEWKVVNDQLGIKINGGSCVTEIMPNDALWNDLGNDYSVEFDMILVGGIDHNFAFRYTDPNNWYGFHIQSPGSLILQRVLNTDIYTNTVNGDFSNGQTIHFKVEIIGEHIKIFRGNPSQLILDYPDAGGRFPTGRIALQASAGGDPSSETYFDNIVVANIDDDNILPVPYYSQNSLPWGPTEYDHSQSLGFPNTTMDKWGCAVTSAAMILNYHKMTEFADGAPVNPGSVNNWLKNNKGYATGKGRGGWYSSLIWSSIGTLTKQLYNASKAKYKLTPIPFSSHNKLNEDLALRQIAGETVGAPPIIKVTKVPLSDSHYVVAKGIIADSVAINDPEWNYANLTFFDNNDYTDLHRYIPSQTDLSSLYFVVNPDVEILVTDPQGRKTGKIFQNGEIQVFNEIPDAIYTYEAPISNPTETGEPRQLGTGANVFFFPTPPDGNYIIKISSLHEGIYTVNLATFKEDGEFEVYKRVGAINSTSTEDFKTQYSKTDPSIITQVVTFESFIEDIKSLHNAGEIKRFGIYISLLAKANIASKMKNINPVVTHEILKSILRELDRQRGKAISEEAYQVLLYDANYLKEHL